MRVAAVQKPPVFLDRVGTTARVVETIHEAAADGVELIAFPETYVAGYPWWADFTHASEFDSPKQKAAFAQYVASAVDIARGDLDDVVAACAETGMFVQLGVAERGPTGTSIYCTLVSIDPTAGIVGTHRKLKPTYGERLFWADGDGNGLRVHEHRGVRVSGLNCWENWMPLARAAIWAQGPEVHVATWPGSPGVAHDPSRFAAMEGRVFVVSAGAVLRAEHLPDDFALRDEMLEFGNRFSSGGSIIVGPDGETVAVADKHEETVLIADLDLTKVHEARHNFDPGGHYSRPDVLRLDVDRARRGPATFHDEENGS